ncbi:MAG: hypothetical protein WBF90_30200, partial [Rivularia sp. (in: cyanobacteria)]
DGEMVSHCVGRVPKAARCAGSPRCSDCRRLVASGATRYSNESASCCLRRPEGRYTRERAAQGEIGGWGDKEK